MLLILRTCANYLFSNEKLHSVLQLALIFQVSYVFSLYRYIHVQCLTAFLNHPQERQNHLLWTVPEIYIKLTENI